MLAALDFKVCGACRNCSVIALKVAKSYPVNSRLFLQRGESVCVLPLAVDVLCKLKGRIQRVNGLVADIYLDNTRSFRCGNYTRRIQQFVAVFTCAAFLCGVRSLYGGIVRERYLCSVLGFFTDLRISRS